MKDLMEQNIMVHNEQNQSDYIKFIPSFDEWY